MLLVLASLLLHPADPAPDRPAVTIRLVRPRVQGERLLALFEGARAPHPAAALAGYRRAKGGNTGLGKAAEAAIASLNPAMIAEWATLDDATLALDPAPDGRLAWGAVVPRDDGTFAAFATAAALTDGGPGAPLDGLPVDRLGPKSSASVAARAPGGFLLAGSRDALASALRRSRAPMPSPALDSALLVHVDPASLQSAAPVSARRAGVILAKLGCVEMDATIRLEGDTALCEVVGRYPTPPAAGRAAIPAGWLDAIPTDGTLAAFAVALDPSPAAWAATFDVLDAAEKVDPTRANVAPIRLRLNLLASAAGLRPDVEVWPLVVGLSGFLRADAAGNIDGAVVRVHAKDEAAVERLHAKTLPKLLRLLTRPGKVPDPGGLAAETSAVSVNGRPVVAERRGDTIVLTWGDPATNRPGDPALKAALGGKARRFAAFWPGRLAAIDLADAPPAVWVGGFEGDRSIDTIRWPGLKAIVRRVVDRLPFDPPPDVATPLTPPG